jgi:hypothetical protein
LTRTFASTPAGHTEIVNVVVDATEALVTDPPLINPVDSVLGSFTTIDPTTGLDAGGLPFQATAFLAVHGLPNAAPANEFAGTSLGAVMAASFGPPQPDCDGDGFPNECDCDFDNNGNCDSSDFLAIGGDFGGPPTGPPLGCTDMTSNGTVDSSDFLLFGTGFGNPVSANCPPALNVFASRGHGATLISPATDLANPVVVEPLVATIPTDPLEFINVAAPGGDLVATVLGSAEVLSGASTYVGSLNLGNTLVKAREFLFPEVPTKGSGFTPTERIYYADANGFPGNPSSGFSDVVTGRDFELALIETALRPIGTIETGATDDFGLIVRVGTTRAGASVVPGELVFLSYMGGREGADIDSLAVPPTLNLTLVIYLDLDPLDTILGAETIDALYVVDASGTGEVNVLDVIAIPEPGGIPMLGAGLVSLALLALRRNRARYSR